MVTVPAEIPVITEVVEPVCAILKYALLALHVPPSVVSFNVCVPKLAHTVYKVA